MNLVRDFVHLRCQSHRLTSAAPVDFGGVELKTFSILKPPWCGRHPPIPIILRSGCIRPGRPADRKARLTPKPIRVRNGNARCSRGRHTLLRGEAFFRVRTWQRLAIPNGVGAKILWMSKRSTPGRFSSGLRAASGSKTDGFLRYADRIVGLLAESGLPPARGGRTSSGLLSGRGARW